MKTRTTAGMLALVFLYCCHPALAAIHYVNYGDSIQTAIDNAVNGDQIEAGLGIYYEAINFKGKAVRLYSSHGPDFTIIDGEKTELHVVQCISGEGPDTILEGFTITGGYAHGTAGPDFNGGGMYNSGGSPTVTNCTFYDNMADYGAGMYNGYGSNPTVTDCLFESNEAEWDGGGMFNAQSSPTLTGCNFTGNSATGTGSGSGNGGGMYSKDDSSPTVTNCTFTGNTAGFGGGMYNKAASSPTVINCTFSGNTAEHGAGMYNTKSNPTVTDCLFNYNEAKLYGAGMYNGYGSNPTVTNCTFTGNTADYSVGGGMYNQGSSPKVTDCTFAHNTAYDYGAGMYNEASSPTVTNCKFTANTADDGGGMFNEGSSPTVINCTFTGNTAGDGGGMYNNYSNPTVTNCIFWNDLNSEIHNIDSSPIFTYSDIQGGTEQDWFGTGCFDADPCFVDAGSGDFRLGPGSPCIDAGKNTAVPSDVLKDLAGKLRYADDPFTFDTGDAGTTGRPVVDMGAHEFQGCGTISQNLLANPGFELGDATGWVTNWGWNLTETTEQVHNGNYSGLASERTDSWQGAWQSLLGLMDDGRTYRISGWVRLQNADSDDVALIVKQVDSGGEHYYLIDSATATDGEWVHLEGIIALGVVGQMTDLLVYFEGPAPNVNFYVDDAAVTEVMGDMNHNGRVDFSDFAFFASYYGFDCSAQDCGLANLNDCDNTINELDLLIFCYNWLVGTEP